MEVVMTTAQLYDMESSSEVNTINKPTPNVSQAGCPSCHPTNSVTARGIATGYIGIYIYTPKISLCGSVAEWLGRWTCDQQVASSNPGLSAIECNPGQVVNTHVPLSPSSIIWYQPMGR